MNADTLERSGIGVPHTVHVTVEAKLGVEVLEYPQQGAEGCATRNPFCLPHWSPFARDTAAVLGLKKTHRAGGVVTSDEGEVLVVSQHEGATPESVLAATAAPPVRAVVVGPAGTGLERAHATLL